MKSSLMISSSVVLCVSAFAALAICGTASQQTIDRQEAHEGSAQPAAAPPIACNLFALNKDQLRRQQELWALMINEKREIHELTDGYAIGIPSDSKHVLAAAELITLERSCCPFFHFELVLDGSDELMWLRLTGRDGVKEFLRLALKAR